jgi:hypothetical protein
MATPRGFGKRGGAVAADVVVDDDGDSGDHGALVAASGEEEEAAAQAVASAPATKGVTKHPEGSISRPTSAACGFQVSGFGFRALNVGCTM